MGGYNLGGASSHGVCVGETQYGVGMNAIWQCLRRGKLVLWTDQVVEQGRERD
jgi:hypothetical protein